MGEVVSLGDHPRVKKVLSEFPVSVEEWARIVRTLISRNTALSLRDRVSPGLR